MATSLPLTISTILLLLFFSPATIVESKKTLLHFYLHDIVSQPNPTAVLVAGPTPAPSFGDIVVIDDPLTADPTITSELIGRAQGSYVFTALSASELVITMSVTFVFVTGEFNGSTLSVLGRNDVLSAVRELPIVGGTGVFRFARGFMQLKTVSFNRTSGDAVVEFNVTVLC